MNIKDFRLVMLMLFVFMLVMLCAPVWATGKDNDNSVTVDNQVDVVNETLLTSGDNISSNSTSIAGSRSYGVGLGSIDVDINQCLGSESTGILVVQWQRLKENPWCMADTLDARGLHEAAARARCSIKTYLALFQSKDECLSFSKVVIPVPSTAMEVVETEEAEEIHEQTLMMLNELKNKVERQERLLMKARQPSDLEKRIAAARQIMQEAEK